MAGAVGKAEGQAEKTATKKRAKLIKESLEYWNTLQKKWGAKDVGLQFGMGSKNAGEYHQKWGEKGASVRLFLPGANAWANARGTTTLTEAKRIMRHEMAHHRQQLKTNVGKNPDAKSKDQETQWHGKTFRAQSKQIGGGRDLREPQQNRPRKKITHPNRARGRTAPPAQRSRANIKKKPVRPKAQMSRKNIKRIRGRLGPPKNAPNRRRPRPEA